MIIRDRPSQIPMRPVVRPLLNPAFWVCLALFAAPLSSVFDFPEEPAQDREELEQKIAPMYASSPGHSVFGEYVGAHWCPPCMDSASPSLANLKASNPEEFTFVSFFESSSGGWPNDSPISRMDHIMSASSGYPTFSFADQQSGSCYKVGSAGTNYYDSDFSSGGCMSSDSADFNLEMSMSLNSSSQDVTIDFEATYSGSQSTIDVYIYGAVTEHIGGDSYDNGVRPHHNWRSWLLNSTNTGFQQATMFKDVTYGHSWTAPLSLVRAAGGYTQWENFWPVIALMDGPHTSYNTFFAAIDPEMGPLIDVGITEFEVENVNLNPGFVPGDTLELSIEIVNNGVEQYTEGGDIGVYVISGSDELYIGGEPIGNLGISGTQSMEVQFDTSGIEMVSSGVTTFRAKLTDMGSDRNSTNNMEDTVALHDLPPTPSQPAAIGSTTFERGDAVQFESTALPNDLIDDMTTMTPTMQYSKSGTSDWSGSWVSNTELVGSGGNAVYVHTIQTPPTADSGSYSIRVMWDDSSGQQSEWLEVQEAFELSNALPRVLSSDDPGFAGTPTVKIDTLESVSLSGLVRDAETPLSMLTIGSSDPEFKGWDAATATISVEFDTIESDPQGNPIPQGIFVSIDDGEDVNNGMLLFNVIENGAPRWSPVPTQPVFEGGSASTSLTSYLTDSDDEGNLLPATGLSLSIVSNSYPELLDVYIEGHSITAMTVDDDSHGVAEVVVRADDGSKSSDTSVIFFVINVNDAPTIDLSGLGEVTLKSNEQHSIDTLPLMSDIDDPSDEIWMDVVTEVPGAVQYDYLNGVLTMQWDEPGTHEVSLTLIDSHGDWSVSQFTVTILDSKPLSWSTDFEPGDLEPQVDGLSVGEDPTITIVNVGDLELSDIKTTWTICNSIVGICHTAGSSNGLGPFVAAPISGNGMAIGDYLTLYVRALDGDGWDRESTETLKLITGGQAQEQPEEPIPEEEETEKQQESGAQSADTGFSSLQIVAAILILIVFIGGGTLVGLYLSGSIGSRAQESTKPPYEGESPIDFEQASPEPVPEPSTIDFEQAAPEPPPAPPGHPPVPEAGLPAGWTMEQWQYYGEEWLKRNQ